SGEAAGPLCVLPRSPPHWVSARRSWWSARRVVGAAVAGPDGRLQVGGGVGRAVADPGDGRADGTGHVDPRSLGLRAELPGPAAEPGGGGELADEEVPLGAE